MDKEQELKLKIDILKTIKDSTIPNILKDTIEISIDKLKSNIEKMEAQLEILKEIKELKK